MSIIDSLLDKLVPHSCVGCQLEGSLLCHGCSAVLNTTTEVRKALDGQLEVKSAVIYESLAKALIWRLKSDGAQAAAQVMARHMAPLLRPTTPCLLVPVPTASSRARQRGYDQAKLLARCLSRQTGLTYADCLVRHGQAHQVGASRHGRRQQMQGVFSVKRARRLQNAAIILVDDVTTTGATLETAAAALQQAGAKQLRAITFAQA
jgi:ComF family protein